MNCEQLLSFSELLTAGRRGGEKWREREGYESEGEGGDGGGKGRGGVEG